MPVNVSTASPEEILRELAAERGKFTRSDKERMQTLTDRLVALGIYPETSGIGLSALRMVECYGVEWATWREPLHCPHCQADLRADSPPFKREIGIIINDRCVTYQCPDCKGYFPNPLPPGVGCTPTTNEE